MWGTFLSEPLRIVGTVVRYTPVCLMRRMPIPVRPKPFLSPGCPKKIYAGLASLSEGCPPDRGRLHTCYSPVRRSPAEKASFLPAAPRLACVKPAASVHPEPGSNSPLLYIFLISFYFVLLFPFPAVPSRYAQIRLIGNRNPLEALALLRSLSLLSSLLIVLLHSFQCPFHPPSGGSPNWLRP